MMTKIGAFVVFLGIIYSFAVGFICYQIGTLNPREAIVTENLTVNAETIVNTPALTTPSPSDTNIIYTVKEYNSRIGVYENDELVRIVDIDVSGLRLQDAKELQKGIQVNSKEDVAAILEDYSS
jgi:hypothetical protein